MASENVLTLHSFWSYFRCIKIYEFFSFPVEFNCTYSGESKHFVYKLSKKHLPGILVLFSGIENF